MPPAQELTVPRPRVPALALPPVALRARVALVVCALAGLSFLFPSAPTYDPWAWIIWGREVLHLDLSTVDGPSWKPLPVLLTTPFALFGPLAPALWLFVARAGAVAGVLATYRLARRLGGMPAGVAAAGAYALAPWTVRNAGLGNSEGLLVALALGAVDRHLAGQRRQAFLLALAAGLLRPEVWPFLGLYGLWLLWRERRERWLVVLGGVVVPVLWLVPEGVGSGDLLRAAHRARTPNTDSPAFADAPARAVVEQFGHLLATPVWIAAGVLAVLAAAQLVRSRGRVARELALPGVLTAAMVILVAEVAYMTNDGFSGNSRYLVLPAALACVLAGAGLGRLVARTPPRVALALGLAAAVAFAAPNVDRLGPTARTLRYQARLADGLAPVIERAGGRDRLLACGTPYAGPFQVPVVAWTLRLHTADVELEPVAPAVVLRARNLPGEPPGPTLAGLGGAAAGRTLASGDGWRIVGTCR
jgi:hypothetical protein